LDGAGAVDVRDIPYDELPADELQGVALGLEPVQVRVDVRRGQSP